MKNDVASTASRDLQALFEVGSLGGLSDGQLLDRFVARREEAVFQAIVHRHGPMVWGVCRRVLRDHHDAEDAFQASFLVLARKAASVVPREKLGNWVYGVAYQTAMKASAMRAKRRVQESQVSDSPEPEAARVDQPDDRLPQLDRELSRLPEKYRVPIVLCELEGKSHREAAEQLGWPIGTVSGRLSRAKSMLAKRLSRSGPTLSVGSLTVLLVKEGSSAFMPNSTLSPTVKAACGVSAKQATTVTVVSTGVEALADGVQRGMIITKFKMIAVLLLMTGTVATGMGRLLLDRNGERKDIDRERGARESAKAGDLPVAGAAAAPLPEVVEFFGQVSEADLIRVGRRKGLKSVTIISTDVTDASLAHLKGLTGLNSVVLNFGGRGISDEFVSIRPGSGADVSDAGLSHLKNLMIGADYVDLNVSGTKVTDAGLVGLGGLEGLKYLDLSGTEVTDAGLVHLKKLPNLLRLYVQDLKISGVGLAHLDGINSIETLSLANTDISDDDLRRLPTLPNLSALFLYNSKLTDAGLKHLTRQEGIVFMDLSGTKITDAGLANIGKLKKLTRLGLKGIKVTTVEVNLLKQRIPGLRVER